MEPLGQRHAEQTLKTWLAAGENPLTTKPAPNGTLARWTIALLVVLFGGLGSVAVGLYQHSQLAAHDVAANRLVHLEEAATTDSQWRKSIDERLRRIERGQAAILERLKISTVSTP